MDRTTYSYRLSRGDTVAVVSLAVTLLGLAIAALAPAYPNLSPLIWQMVLWASVLGALASIIFLALHHIAPPAWTRHLRRGPVAWRFEDSGYALELEWRLKKRYEPLEFFVPGFVFSGKNVSGRPLYRPDAFVTIQHSGRIVPLYIAAGGQWIEFSDAKEIPADADFQIGCQMRGDTLHCADWTERMTPEQFLREIGGFKLTFSCDGSPSRYWKFTTEDLRKQFEHQKRKAEADVSKMHPPRVERRN